MNSTHTCNLPTCACQPFPGNEGQDIILGDFGVMELNPSAPWLGSARNLGGVLSIDSLECLQDAGSNEMYGHDGDGKLSFLIFSISANHAS